MRQKNTVRQKLVLKRAQNKKTKPKEMEKHGIRFWIIIMENEVRFESATPNDAYENRYHKTFNE